MAFVIVTTTTEALFYHYRRLEELLDWNGQKISSNGSVAMARLSFESRKERLLATPEFLFAMLLEISLS
jgi:hypothetical protein